jgi:hypothetical protein
MEASIQGAKAYAQTARNVAYLEGKVSKLSALVDHYRFTVYLLLAFDNIM